MKMPFGKYRGRDVADLPEDYTIWLLEHVRLRPTLRRAVEARLGLLELERLRDELRAECAQLMGELDNDTIGRWYREMARRFHPDAGGSHEAMKAINAGKELLLELTKEREYV